MGGGYIEGWVCTGGITSRRCKRANREKRACLRRRHKSHTCVGGGRRREGEGTTTRRAQQTRAAGEQQRVTHGQSPPLGGAGSVRVSWPLEQHQVVD